MNGDTVARDNLFAFTMNAAYQQRQAFTTGTVAGAAADSCC